jgi:L-Lysine epsilon oxidase N-terminal/L-lysine epsilon oxidase C-terminal domain/Iron-containing redox enzyme
MATIAYCEIYPSIGIARLGDSPTGYYVGPEAPGNPPKPEGGFKDPEGRIKRQAARFRVYGFDDAGNVVQEITSDMPGAFITWTAQLANQKAAWFRFLGVKIGQQLDQNGDPTKLRNRSVTDRTKLAITPSARSVSGADQSGTAFQFADGFFFDHPVYLGELQTDQQGRLLVLGGRGKSGHTDQAKPIFTYANNDYWHDDVSDGPVTVSVKLNGAEVPLKGSAWVLVAPPKFAPYHENIVTLYEVMGETSGVKPPDKLSFTRDIYPIFDRMAGYQWVNATALRGHGPLKRGNFRDPSIIAQLSDNTDAQAAYRKSVLARIRNPRLKSVDQANYYFMPLLSGDEGDAQVGKPETWLYLLESQYAKVGQWADGNFDSDWAANAPPPPAFDQIAVEDQPAALTRAALEYCVGGPFFPGIELTYVARYPDWFEKPYRFKAGKFQPGDMTKRMAVPWQADFYECEVHWWPAQRPDDVINEETFEAALVNLKEDARDGQLANALQDRIRWDRGLGDRLRVDPPGLPGDNDMVEKWKTLGFVLPRTTPYGETLYVETGRSQYDGLRDRDYLFYLLNIDAYPTFIPKAKQLAEEFLQGAVDLLDDPDPAALDDMYRYFDYSPAALAQRLDEIYAFYQMDSESDPLADPDNLFKSLPDMVERIRQFAPLNQLDGAWIRNAAHAGPIDRVTANLFNVWMDEVGDGNPNQNHANVYTQLLEKVGVQLDPIYTQAYANNPDILDSAYTVPMYELAISQFTQTFYPEILGMTLQLEWEVLALKPTIKLLRHFGIDPHFYELHVGIDNAANGHGAKAREAVEWYLDQALARGGDAEVQRLWRRIWTGYVAFATTGTLGQDLRDLLKQRRESPATPADKVADMMARKKPYGSLNHGDRRLGPNLINDLFEDPDAFMKALIENNYIVPGSISESTFFKAISFEGPMYKVFTDDEIRIWEDWVVSLGKTGPPDPPETDPAKLMAMCVDALRERQTGEPAHAATQLTGPDPAHPGQTLTQPVAAWFSSPTRALMSALSDPANGWIVKGSSVTSRFITELLDGSNAMSQAFAGTGPKTGGKTWRQIAADWIDKGCPLPPAPAPAQAMFAASSARLGRRALSRLTLTSPVAQVAAHPRRRVLGMGVVH